MSKVKAYRGSWIRIRRSAFRLCGELYGERGEAADKRRIIAHFCQQHDTFEIGQDRVRCLADVETAGHVAAALRLGQRLSDRFRKSAQRFVSALGENWVGPADFSREIAERAAEHMAV